MLNAGNSILDRLVRFVFICIQFARLQSTRISQNSKLVASSCPAMSALISETPQLFASPCTAISPPMSSKEYVQPCQHSYPKPLNYSHRHAQLYRHPCPAKNMSNHVSTHILNPELVASSCTAISPPMSSKEYVQALFRQRLAPERVSITTKTGRRVMKVDIRYAINDSTMGTL